MTHFSVIITILSGIVAILVVGGGILQRIFAAGAKWEKLIGAVDTLTTAADRLSTAFDVFAKNTQEQINGLEHRLFILENKDKSSV